MTIQTSDGPPSVLSEYLQYSRPYWKALSFYLLAIPAYILSGAIALPLLIRRLVDLFISTGPGPVSENSYSQGLYIVLWIGAAALLTVLLRLLADIAICNVNPFVQRDIENDCYSRLSKQSFRFFSDLQTGAIVAKIRRYSDAYDATSFNLTRGFYCIFLQLVFTTSVIAYFSPLISLIVAIWAVFFVMIDLKLILWKMRLDQDRSAAESQTMGVIADSLSNFASVKIFAKEELEAQRVDRFASKAAQKLQLGWYASLKIFFVEGILMAIVQIAVFAVSLNLWAKGAVSVGTLVMIQTYILSLCALLAEFGNYNKALFRNLASASEMSAILAQPLEVRDVDVPETAALTKGQIHFERVTFSYGSPCNIFSDFCLSLQPGERLALVGASGAGKTSLVKLLLRFMDPTSGRILIDGQDISKIPQQQLRNAISFVPQEAGLFHRTIYDNISFGALNPTREEVLEAARRAYIHDYIQALPNGYDTMVGERGIKLSGGERQRIGIARVMLRKAPILILDEATNSLDAISEKFVQMAFENLMRDRTTIVIAHRLATIQMMDRILVLRNGTIVETGNHQQLLQKNGEYRQFWQEQQLHTVETLRQSRSNSL